MDSQAMLKTVAFGGFDKKSVINYVYELNENAKNTQDSLNAELEELAATRERLGQSLAETETKLQKQQKEFSAQLANERARSSELSELVEGLNAEIVRQETVIAEKDEEARRLSRRNDELKEKSAELEKKREEIERATAQVGRLILNARADADNIVAEAHTQSEQRLSGAETEARIILDRARAEAMEITEAARQKADELSRQALGEVEETTKRANLEADGIIEAAKQDCEHLNRQFREMREELKHARKLVADMLEDMGMKFAAVAEVVDSAQLRLESTGAGSALTLAEDLAGDTEADESGEPDGQTAQSDFFPFPAEDRAQV